MSKNFHQSHSQVPAGFVAVVVRCQGGDPPGTGKAVRASMVVTLRTPWGDQWTLEDSGGFRDMGKPLQFNSGG